MDENEIKQDEELDEEIDTDEEMLTDVDEDEDEDHEEDPVEFETDDDGNVIIPGDGEDEDADDADSKDGDDPAPAPATEEEPKTEEEPDPRDDEKESLKRQLKAMTALSRDMLKKMGVSEEDVMKGMAQLAAEASDGEESAEEYLKKIEDELKKQEEAEIAEYKKYEAMAKADLAELKALYPELADLKDLRDLPRDIRSKFAKYRDMGLTVQEAYSAANPDGIRKSAAEAATKAAKKVDSGKSHLKSSVPKGANSNRITIPRETIQEWMEDLGVSREEAIRIYLKTKKN